VASGQSQQAQSVQPSAQSVPDSKTYLESASRDSHPIPSDELVERLEDISNSESASGINQGTIDNRIEQAMDLVKSHLMNAVRSEVEELKEKIIKLEETISQQQVEMTKNREDFNREVGKLQTENEFLRNHVGSEVINQLSNLQSYDSVNQQPQQQTQQNQLQESQQKEQQK